MCAEGAILRRLLLLLGAVLQLAAAAETYDVVIHGGRVMDPETGLDAIRDVGVSGDRIARIAAEPLTGRRVIDAAGLVVAPGFIDLHQHGQDEESGRLKLFDGVTTALEMEVGAPDIGEFLRAKQGHALIHYGATASHVAARAAAFGAPLPPGEILPHAGPATDQSADPARMAAILARLDAQIAAGGLGIGMGIQYTPGATRAEVIQIFRLAAARGLPVFTHIRSFGRTEPGSSIEAVSEVIGAAAVTGAALQIVHVNSSCVADALECLAMIEGARARGLDVTTEAYPYTAGMTMINSALFNPGWREKLGIDYDALQLPGSGEKLTRERFEALHAAPAPQPVLIFSNPEALIDRVVAHPLVSIASDGAPGHPRNAGTFARILAREVREKGVLTLMDALRKMTLMPARRLERATPAARRKGRLQEGADADIVVFDPTTIADRATYAAPSLPSRGMRAILVAGTPLVEDGTLIAGLHPGRPLTP